MCVATQAGRSAGAASDPGCVPHSVTASCTAFHCLWWHVDNVLQFETDRLQGFAGPGGLCTPASSVPPRASQVVQKGAVMFARDADDAVSSGESGGRTAPSSGSSASALRVLLLLVVWATSVVPATGQPQPGTVNARSSPIAITPSGRTLLTVNPDSNSLTLVDTESLQVKAELSVGLDPRAVAVAPHGSWAVVASQGSDSISVIDLEASTVRRTIEVGDRPVGVAVSPGGDLLAVAELGADRVRLLDTATWNTCGLYTVGDRPHGLAFTPDGGQLLITHLLRGEVTVLTVEPRRVYLPLVLKQCSPRAAAGITSQESASVARTTVATIPTWSNVAPAPAIAVNRSGTRAYLPQTMAHGLGLNTQFDNTVFPKISVLNLEAGLHQTSEHISLPETDQPVGLPWDCVLARDDQELWVVNAGSNDVSIIGHAGVHGHRDYPHHPHTLAAGAVARQAALSFECIPEACSGALDLLQYLPRGGRA